MAADGVAVTLIASETAREIAGSTGALSRQLEELQFMLGEGPGLESFGTGAPALACDLRSATARWPVFTPAAAGLGVGAVFSFPLRFGAVAIGTLEAYRHEARELTEEEAGDAFVFADTAALLLLEPYQRGESGDPVDGAARLAQDYHIEVYQATGMLSVQLRTNLDDALARLRGYAFANDMRISAVAREILTGRLALGEGSTGA
ncbi:hypothetical protein LP52_02865 [Streptomonospora alba]|uniref:ANTAR domain-containing protein n=1 Tax=Streptomonospora alba TaxID=183763 RepID=A0A0C2GA72_9ACTN|nr:hypothetical protein LP52_02865 [Streptomonospora alba]